MKMRVSVKKKPHKSIAVKVETIIPCFQLILAAKKHMYFLLVI